MQEIRDRLTTLETKHEERHNQTLSLIDRIEKTQERIAGAVESLVENQSKMSYLHIKVDRHEVVVGEHSSKIQMLETRQGIMWKVLGVIGTAIIVTAIRMWM